MLFPWFAIWIPFASAAFEGDGCVQTGWRVATWLISGIPSAVSKEGTFLVEFYPPRRSMAGCNRHNGWFQQIDRSSGRLS